jgi:hypothetical protein
VTQRERAGYISVHGQRAGAATTARDHNPKGTLAATVLLRALLPALAVAAASC